MSTVAYVTPDTQVTVKIFIYDKLIELKIPLRDLEPKLFLSKLKSLLNVPADQQVLFERFSDSAGVYVTLSPENERASKALYRAAKFKLNLRLRATILESENVETPEKMPSLPAASPIVEPSIQKSSVGTLDMSDMARHLPTEDSNPTLSEYNEPAAHPNENSTALRNFTWSVCCNSCDKAMDDEHFHCNVCDNGDYDLCAACVDSGIHCQGEGHWLIKRFLKNGNLITSTTEMIGPKNKHIVQKEMPGAFVDEKKIEAEHYNHSSRACNSCVREFPDTMFVSCTFCNSYDLCLSCYASKKHGHHPGHTFRSNVNTNGSGSLAQLNLAPGTDVWHDAICDGCDKLIHGIRHKCLNCPDWDYCSDCFKNANSTHPRHRFAPIYDPLPKSQSSTVRHFGIYCDGPLCSKKPNQSFIQGPRYKCIVCDDVDFCASCEAIPTNRHNRTHPLVLFKTQVKNVSVTSFGKDRLISDRAAMDDLPTSRSTATETTPAPSANAATQVQTILEMKPTEVSQSNNPSSKVKITNILADPINKEVVSLGITSPVSDCIIEVPPKLEVQVKECSLNGLHKVHGEKFVHFWILRNPGPLAWPAGCSIYFTSGVNMLNIDDGHPLSATEFENARKSNTTDRSIEPGEDFVFLVCLRAPKWHIQAISHWHLKTKDGTAFGETMICEINIGTSKAQSPVSIVSPPGHSLNRCPESMLRNSETPGNYSSAEEIAVDNSKAQVTSHNQQSKNDLLQEHFLNKDDVDGEIEFVDKQAGILTPVKDSAKEEEQKICSESSSLMVFPQLPKESPPSGDEAASTFKDLTKIDLESEADGRIEAPNSPSYPLDDESFVNSMVLESELSSGDDFLTDEEYDVLDTSDEGLLE